MRLPKFIGVVVALIAGIAIAQTRLPTDVELKTAYCIAVLDTHISLLRGITPETNALRRSVAEVVDKAHRLRSYLLPKLSQLESEGLVIAARRAQQDIELAIADGQEAHACASRCSPGKPEKVEQCSRACFQPGARQERLSSCQDLQWLPF